MLSFTLLILFFLLERLTKLCAFRKLSHLLVIAAQGIAGDDLPHVLLPSVLAVDAKSAKRARFSVLTRAEDGVEVVSAFGQDALVENWHNFESILTHTLSTELHINPRENALLYAEPNHNGRSARERLVELLFEKYEMPALYLARSAVLSAYANGRTTGVVLDIGHSGTSAVPVVEGSVVKGNFIRTHIGGRSVSEVLRAQLEENETKLRPVWSFRRTLTRSDDEGMRAHSTCTEVPHPNVTTSYTQFAVTTLLEEIKAGICRVHDNPAVDVSTLPIPQSTYELPDGQSIEMSTAKFEAAEKTLFGKLPHVVNKPNGDTRLSYVNQFLNRTGSGANGSQNAQPSESNGLHSLVVDAIRRCDQSIHRDMYAGVCLTGGTSDMAGLFERLSTGLMEMYYKVRVLAATGSHERKYCAWTGGSILATFSEFQKMWFSRSEYDENGASFVHRKCP